jgi:hypothetical protein
MLSDCTAVSLPTSLTQSAGNKIGDDAKKALREAKKAHNSHLPPGMKELRIDIN